LPSIPTFRQDVGLGSLKVAGRDACPTGLACSLLRVACICGVIRAVLSAFQVPQHLLHQFVGVGRQFQPGLLRTAAVAHDQQLLLTSVMPEADFRRAGEQRIRHPEARRNQRFVLFLCAVSAVEFAPKSAPAPAVSPCPCCRSFSVQAATSGISSIPTPSNQRIFPPHKVCNQGAQRSGAFEGGNAVIASPCSIKAQAAELDILRR
jgi:hypothetical protein